MEMYVVTRQTTEKGTATEVIKVNGRDLDEAVLKAKIKGYKAMETFMSESTMVSAYFEVTDLNGNIYTTESWKSES